jgi:hypothetical protein
MSISPLDVIFKPVTVRGFYMGHPEFATKLAPVAAQAAEMIASGRLHIPVAATYPMSSIKQAVAHAQRAEKSFWTLPDHLPDLGIEHSIWPHDQDQRRRSNGRCRLSCPSLRDKDRPMGGIARMSIGAL